MSTSSSDMAGKAEKSNTNDNTKIKRAAARWNAIVHSEKLKKAKSAICHHFSGDIPSGTWMPGYNPARAHVQQKNNNEENLRKLAACNPGMSDLTNALCEKCQKEQAAELAAQSAKDRQMDSRKDYES